MTDVAVQKTKNKCPKCGRTFDTLDELREHERNCTGKAKEAGGGTGPEKKSEATKDMEIEDRFEATDN